MPILRMKDLPVVRVPCRSGFGTSIKSVVALFDSILKSREGI